MKLNDRKLYDVQFSLEELEALQGAERAITEIVTLFGSEGTLVAAETGECVDLSELNRVRAILDFIHDHRIFERMKEKGRREISVRIIFRRITSKQNEIDY